MKFLAFSYFVDVVVSFSIRKIERNIFTEKLDISNNMNNGKAIDGWCQCKKKKKKESILNGFQ